MNDHNKNGAKSDYLDAKQLRIDNRTFPQNQHVSQNWRHFFFRLIDSNFIVTAFHYEKFVFFNESSSCDYLNMALTHLKLFWLLIYFYCQPLYKTQFHNGGLYEVSRNNLKKCIDNFFINKTMTVLHVNYNELLLRIVIS